MDNEQWKSEGNCILCRRSSYCGRPCSANKKRIDRMKEQAFRDVFTEKYPELAAVMDSVPKYGM